MRGNYRLFKQIYGYTGPCCIWKHNILHQRCPLFRTVDIKRLNTHLSSLTAIACRDKKYEWMKVLLPNLSRYCNIWHLCHFSATLYDYRFGVLRMTDLGICEGHSICLLMVWHVVYSYDWVHWSSFLMQVAISELYWLLLYLWELNNRLQGHTVIFYANSWLCWQCYYCYDNGNGNALWFGTWFMPIH